MRKQTSAVSFLDGRRERDGGTSICARNRGQSPRESFEEGKEELTDGRGIRAMHRGTQRRSLGRLRGVERGEAGLAEARLAHALRKAVALLRKD